jgi:hypothetical protein
LLLLAQKAISDKFTCALREPASTIARPSAMRDERDSMGGTAYFLTIPFLTLVPFAAAGRRVKPLQDRPCRYSEPAHLPKSVRLSA